MNAWIGIFVACVMQVTKLAIKKAVSHSFVNTSVSAASVDRVMLLNLVELQAMGTEF